MLVKALFEDLKHDVGSVQNIDTIAFKALIGATFVGFDPFVRAAFDLTETLIDMMFDPGQAIVKAAIDGARPFCELGFKPGFGAVLSILSPRFDRLQSFFNSCVESRFVIPSPVRERPVDRFESCVEISLGYLQPCIEISGGRLGDLRGALVDSLLDGGGSFIRIAFNRADALLESLVKRFFIVVCAFVQAAFNDAQQF